MKFYYIRDEKKRPIITVAVERDGDLIHRAVAKCNLAAGDSPSKKRGRLIAEGRLLKLRHRGYCHEVSSERTGLEVGLWVHPLPYERRLLGLPNE